MPTEDAYSSGHLALSHFWTCMCSNVETNLSWTCLVSGLLTFGHPSVILFWEQHQNWHMSVYTICCLSLGTTSILTHVCLYNILFILTVDFCQGCPIKHTQVILVEECGIRRDYFHSAQTYSKSSIVYIFIICSTWETCNTIHAYILTSVLHIHMLCYYAIGITCIHNTKISVMPVTCSCIITLDICNKLFPFNCIK